MASTSSTSTAAPMPPLKTWQRVLFKMGIYIAVVFLCVGVGGILVLTGVLSKCFSEASSAAHTAHIRLDHSHDAVSIRFHSL
jgi:hypothetical protein